MAKGLIDGKIIYKDLFDHKGPIMYVINAIGILINNKFGIGYIEIVLIFVSSIFIYKTAKIYLKSYWALFIAAEYIMFLFIPISRGNLTEDYGSIFSAIGLYYVIKILQKQEIEVRVNWIMIGLTFALTFFIKPTYISLWIAFAIVMLVYFVKNKKTKELGMAILYASIGFGIITLPIIFYMLINNCMYISNFSNYV